VTPRVGVPPRLVGLLNVIVKVTLFWYAPGLSGRGVLDCPARRLVMMMLAVPKLPESGRDRDTEAVDLVDMPVFMCMCVIVYVCMYGRDTDTEAVDLVDMPVCVCVCMCV
jgi:hypothetical protein